MKSCIFPLKFSPDVLVPGHLDLQIGEAGYMPVGYLPQPDAENMGPVYSKQFEAQVRASTHPPFARLWSFRVFVLERVQQMTPQTLL